MKTKRVDAPTRLIQARVNPPNQLPVLGTSGKGVERAIVKLNLREEYEIKNETKDRDEMRLKAPLLGTWLEILGL